jgi:P-type Mg2+ transporter
MSRSGRSGPSAVSDTATATDGKVAWRELRLIDAAGQSGVGLLKTLGSTAAGLESGEARRRLQQVGPNAVRSHGARPLAVLARQLNSPLLLLLVAAALVSIAVGEHANEFRSERAVQALHDRIRHTALTIRDGRPVAIDMTELVPGDVVRLGVGDVVPADLRLLQVDGLQCDEAVLTGESLAETKTAKPVEPASPLDLPSCALMGTVVHAGMGLGVVVRTGPRTEFGQIATRLGQRHEQTAFQHGLRDFSVLLVRITAVLAVSIFVINGALGRSLLESGLFALAIAVGLTPQLLPAIVTISLSTGARRLARARVVVKRLVAIEDLGNIEVLCTDKTGTLTEGRIRFEEALDPAGACSSEVLRLGLLCNQAVVEGGRAVAGNPLDQALWEAVLAAGEVERSGDGKDPLGARRGWRWRRSTTTAASPPCWLPRRTADAAC